MTIDKDRGIMLGPKVGDDMIDSAISQPFGVLLNWGVRGEVETIHAGASPMVDGRCVELGGVLGIIRLWESE